MAAAYGLGRLTSPPQQKEAAFINKWLPEKGRKRQQNSCDQPAARSSHTKIRLKTARWPTQFFILLRAHPHYFHFFIHTISLTNTHLHLSFTRTHTHNFHQQALFPFLKHAYPQRIHRHHSCLPSHLWFPARLALCSQVVSWTSFSVLGTAFMSALTSAKHPSLSASTYPVMG